MNKVVKQVGESIKYTINGICFDIKYKEDLLSIENEAVILANANAF